MKDYDAIAREIYRDEAISRMLYYDQQEDQCVELIAAIIRKHDEAEAGGAHCGCCGKWMPNGSEEWDLCDACAKPAPTDEKALREALQRMTNRSNRITCPFRHQHDVRAIRADDIESLYEAQLEAESILAREAPKDEGKEGAK